MKDEIPASYEELVTRIAQELRIVAQLLRIALVMFGVVLAMEAAELTVRVLGGR